MLERLNLVLEITFQQIAWSAQGWLTGARCICANTMVTSPRGWVMGGR